jgi:hypothetical protein
MMHPATRLVSVSEQVGLGVVATRPLPAGTILWARDALDQVIPERARHAMPAALAQSFTRHAYLDDEGMWTLCWDAARYVNHSCAANSVVTDHGMELACRDIAAGEQITNEYALFKLERHEEFECRCGHAQCRGRIDSRGDLGTYRRQQRERVRLALAGVSSVEQALWPLLVESQKQFLKGPRHDDR